MNLLLSRLLFLFYDSKYDCVKNDKDIGEKTLKKH